MLGARTARNEAAIDRGGHAGRVAVGARQHTLDRYHALDTLPSTVYDDLVALAAEVGLDADAAREMLAGSAYLDQVVEDQVLARTFGANGVPFFVIDRAYGVSGAQPVEVFLNAIDQARAASA